MMDGMKKNIGRENPKKREGTRLQGIVKTKLEVVEMENVSLFPRIYDLNYSLTV